MKNITNKNIANANDRVNGKVGDIRNANIYTGRFEVHFEDINLKPCMVRPDNLEILFELPAK